MLAFYVAMLDTEEQKITLQKTYTTYYGMMYQVARTITCDDKLAEDTLYETCLELIRSFDSIRTDNAKQLAYYLRMFTRSRTMATFLFTYIKPSLTRCKKHRCS